MNHNRLSGLAFRAPLFFSRILSNRNLFVRHGQTYANINNKVQD